MRSAVLFLPSLITTLMKRPTMRSLYFASGRIRRFGTSRLLGISSSAGRPARKKRPGGHLPARPMELLLGSLRAVLRTAAVAVGDARRVERAAHDVVADARKVLHASA